MKKKTISSLLAVCLSASMVGSMSVSMVSAEDTVTKKTLFKEDFENTTAWDIKDITAKNALSATGSFVPTCGYDKNNNVITPGYRIKQDVVAGLYNYSNTQVGDMRSYYNMANINYHTVSEQYGPLSRAMIMGLKETDDKWYVDIALGVCDDEYNNITVGDLAKKALDISFLMAYQDGVTSKLNEVVKADEPLYVNLVFTANGQEVTYPIGSRKINKSGNRQFNNGIHMRNALNGILSLADAQAKAENVHIRITGNVAKSTDANGKIVLEAKELGFDNFLVKEVDPKQVFSEDFEERAWFGFMESTDYIQNITVEEIEGRGKVLKITSQRDIGFNHQLEMPIPNADRSKCYKVAFDMCYPSTNKTDTVAEASITERNAANKSNTSYTLIKTKKNDDGFVHYEAVFDYSYKPDNLADPKDMRLRIKFGDGQNYTNDVMYLDNITVTEVPVRIIQAHQGTNYFQNPNTLINGDLVVTFRNTEEACKGIVAAYDSNGKLLNVDITDVPTDRLITKTVAVTENVQKVSAFAWNSSLSTLEPIMQSASVTKPE